MESFNRLKPINIMTFLIRKVRNSTEYLIIVKPLLEGNKEQAHSSLQTRKMTITIRLPWHIFAWNILRPRSYYMTWKNTKLKTKCTTITITRTRTCVSKDVLFSRKPMSHPSLTYKFIIKSTYIMSLLKALPIHLFPLQLLNSSKAHTLNKHLLDFLPFKDSPTVSLRL